MQKCVFCTIERRKQTSRYHSSLMTDNAFKTIIQADISDSDLQRLRCKVNRKCLKQK
jgi:hypothetical protein